MVCRSAVYGFHVETVTYTMNGVAMMSYFLRPAITRTRGGGACLTNYFHFYCRSHEGNFDNICILDKISCSRII